MQAPAIENFFVAMFVGVFSISIALACLAIFTEPMILTFAFVAALGGLVVGSPLCLVWWAVFSQAIKILGSNFLTLFLSGLLAIALVSHVFMFAKSGFILSIDEYLNLGVVAVPYGFICCCWYWFLYMRKNHN